MVVDCCVEENFVDYFVIYFVFKGEYGIIIWEGREVVDLM